MLQPLATQTRLAIRLGECGDRCMSRRADIGPLTTPEGLLLGFCVVDAVPHQTRHVYRLVGTGDAEVRGLDPTGRSVRDGYFSPSIEDLLSNYDRVVGFRAPHIHPQHYIAATGRYTTKEGAFFAFVQ